MKRSWGVNIGSRLTVPVKSVNGILPDIHGNVRLPTGLMTIQRLKPTAGNINISTDENSPYEDEDGVDMDTVNYIWEELIKLSGAGRSGYNPSTTYPENTVGRKLNEFGLALASLGEQLTQYTNASDRKFLDINEQFSNIDTTIESIQGKLVKTDNLQGIPLGDLPPETDDALVFNGTAWVPKKFDGSVKTVNGVEPDENGNIRIKPYSEIFTVDDTTFTITEEHVGALIRLRADTIVQVHLQSDIPEMEQIVIYAEGLEGFRILTQDVILVGSPNLTAGQNTAVTIVSLGDNTFAILGGSAP